MKHSRVVLAGAFLVMLAIAGCSGASTEPALATTTAAGSAFSDAEFVAAVRDDDGGYFDGKPDSEIFETADVICGIFTPSKGGDPDLQMASTLKTMVALGFTGKSAGSFMVLATAQRCIVEYPYLNSAVERATGR